MPDNGNGSLLKTGAFNMFHCKFTQLHVEGIIPIICWKNKYISEKVVLYPSSQSGRAMILFKSKDDSFKE